MDKTTGTKYLTKTEKKRFDAMARFDTIKAAALSIGLAPSTLYNWRGDVKKRYRKLVGKANAYLAQTRRGGKLSNLLKEKRQMKAPDENVEWHEVEDEEEE